MTTPTPPGTIVWRDLTVEDAGAIEHFYRAVVGWRAEPHDMGEWADFDIYPAEGDEPIAGICHARGANANVPAQWLVYVQVEDVDASATRAVELGGAIVDGPRAMGDARFAVIRDPAGAVLALIGPG